VGSDQSPDSGVPVAPPVPPVAPPCGIRKQEGTHPFHRPPTTGGSGGFGFAGGSTGWAGILEFDKCAAGNQGEMHWYIRSTGRKSCGPSP